MTSLTRPAVSARTTDPSVVTSAVDIAGARHEILPPRRITQGEPSTRPVFRAWSP
ncbi:hypothetical protein ACOKGD_09205 [Microbacterium phosphatis]|uniref:hypothetical protein n=1 Tax=Microbacterium phosphatis TaxID=3140248 RepID=UPI00313FF444